MAKTKSKKKQSWSSILKKIGIFIVLNIITMGTTYIIENLVEFAVYQLGFGEFGVIPDSFASEAVEKYGKDLPKWYHDLKIIGEYGLNQGYKVVIYVLDLMLNTAILMCLDKLFCGWCSDEISEVLNDIEASRPKSSQSNDKTVTEVLKTQQQELENIFEKSRESRLQQLAKKFKISSNSKSKNDSQSLEMCKFGSSSTQERSRNEIESKVDLNKSPDEFKPTSDDSNAATTTTNTTKAIIENEPSASQPFGISEFGSSSTQERSRIESDSKIDIIESKTVVITNEQAQESLSRLENILKKFQKSSN